MALIGSIRAAFNEGYKPAKINSMKETEKIKMIYIFFNINGKSKNNPPENRKCIKLNWLSS